MVNQHKKTIFGFLAIIISLSTIPAHTEDAADVLIPTALGAGIGGAAGGGRGAGIGAAVGLGTGLIAHGSRRRDRDYRGYSEREYRREIRALENENERLYRRLENSEAENAELQEEVNELSSQVKGLHSENKSLATFEKENAKLSRHIEDLEEDNSELQEQVDDLKNQLKEAEQEARKLKNK